MKTQPWTSNNYFTNKFILKDTFQKHGCQYDQQRHAVQTKVFLKIRSFFSLYAKLDTYFIYITDKNKFHNQRR